MTRTQPNKALQLTARQHASQVTLLFSLDADRAPQRKASVMRAKSSLVLFLTLWATAHVISFYWILTDSFHVPRCRGNCFVVSELARVLLGEAFLMLFLGILLPLFADLGLGVIAHSWRQFLLFVVLAVLALQIEGLLLDWMGDRLYGLKQDYYGWAREIFFRFALPAIFVGVGASAGAVKRKYLFVPRSKHA